MRVFGGSGVKSMMNKFGLPEDMPITSGMVSNMLESAQEKIEGFHFDSRKHTLQYDDVLNHQRQGIYERRRKILLGDAKEMQNILEELYAVKPELVDTIKEKEEKYSKETLQEVLRNIYLQIVDQYFMAHLEHMDYIRQSVNLRAYGQRDPLVEYKKEALLTYRAMQDKMKEDFYNFIIHVDNVIANIEAQKIMRDSQMKNQTHVALENNGSTSSTSDNEKKIGRNDQCLCGSGKKVKKCDCKEYEYLRK